MEYGPFPLPGSHYVCLGAQPHAVSREHRIYAKQRGCRICWCEEVRGSLERVLTEELTNLGPAAGAVHLSLDADVVQIADVPGVSAPNSLGLTGQEVARFARVAGRDPRVTSFDLVEINPSLDRDGQSARWAALIIWNFLAGLACRARM
jgi:formiminoglutamase